MNSSGLFALDPLRDERWRKLVHGHPAASVFHSTEWLSALRLAYGYEPVVYTNGDPSSQSIASGIVFCKVRSWLTGRRLVSVPFSDHCDPLVESSAELDDLLLRVRESVPAGNGSTARSGRCASNPALPPGSGKAINTFGTSSICGPASRAFSGICIARFGVGSAARSAKRSPMRKATRSLLRAVLQIGGGDPQTAKFTSPTDPVVSQFDREPRIEPYHPGCVKGRLAHCQHLDPESQENNHLQIWLQRCPNAPAWWCGAALWNTIQQAKAAECETLDLGRTDTGNEGLVDFKEHWGGVRSELRYWRYPGRPGRYELGETGDRGGDRQSRAGSSADRGGKSAVPTHRLSQC